MQVKKFDENVEKFDFEFVQVVQNLDRKTPLIQSKPVVLRVYLKPGIYSTNKISANLKIKKNNVVLKTISTQFTLSPKGSTDTEIQRKYYHSSLNFYIPGEFIKSDNKFELNINGEEYAPHNYIPDLNTISILNKTIKFNLRTIGIRYKDDIYKSLDLDKSNNIGRKGLQKTHQPNNNYIREFESLAQRCLPVSEFNASHITIDAPLEFRPPFPKTSIDDDSYTKNSQLQKNHLMALHAFLMAVRSMDIEFQDIGTGNAFEKTYYYGMFDGPTDDLRGAVSDVPAKSDDQFTGNVGVGPADAEGYYGLHELCHLLGALHPGDPKLSDEEIKLNDERGKLKNENLKDEHNNIKKEVKTSLKKMRHDLYTGQDEEDQTLINSGKLNARSQNDLRDSFVGLDIGDSTHPVSVKHYLDYYDIMTYRYNLWISNYTYEALIEKLSKVFQNSANKTGNGSSRFFRIIASYSEESNDQFNLLYIFPVDKLLPDSHLGEIKSNSGKNPQTGIKLHIDFGDKFDSYVTVNRRKTPHHNNSSKSMDWGIFQTDIEIPGGKAPVSISIGEDSYPVQAEAQDTLTKSIGDLTGKLTAFDNDDGFKIRLIGIPTDCQYMIAVKNTTAGNFWQTVAVESIQERLDRTANHFDIFIDKHVIEPSPGSVRIKAWENLNLRVRLIRGFEIETRDYIPNGIGSWTIVEEPDSAT